MLSFQSFIPVANNVEYISINGIFHFYFANKKKNSLSKKSTFFNRGVVNYWKIMHSNKRH